MAIGNPETVKVSHPDIEGETMVINREDYDKEKHGNVVTGRKPVKAKEVPVEEISCDNIANVKAKALISYVEGLDSENEDDKLVAQSLLDAENTGKGRQAVIDSLDDFING